MSHIQSHWPPGRGPSCPLCRTRFDAPCLLIRRHQPGQPPGTDADLVHVECIERASAALSHSLILAAIEVEP
jgi:hypothetical protein